jgi:hypothetical protein
VPEARRALVRVRLPGTRLKEVLLSGTGLSGTGLPGTGLPEPGLPDALLSRWPRLTLARSWCLAPACPAGTVLSRLVLTLTGHAALSGT